MHKHHIVPRHMGGTDDPSNLIEVTIEEHAELHLDLYLTHGLMGDWLAFHMLSGQISAAEATKQAQIHANRTRVWSEESRKKISDANKAREINYFERRVFTPEYRKKLSDAAKNRKDLKRGPDGKFLKKKKDV